MSDTSVVFRSFMRSIELTVSLLCYDIMEMSYTLLMNIVGEFSIRIASLT